MMAAMETAPGFPLDGGCTCGKVRYQMLTALDCSELMQAPFYDRM